MMSHPDRPFDDKVLLEVLRNRFQGVVNEMGTAIQRTGHTMFIKETADFGSVLVTPEGEIFSAPLNVGVTVLIGTPMADAIQAVDRYEEGDVLIANDPGTTGAMSTHLPDLYVWRPIFVNGELLCFAWTFLHCSDIGGKVPGSISPTSFDLFQEGLVIPPTKLVEAGRLNEQFLTILHANSRIPEQNWGDLKSLLAALTIGDRRVHALVDRYGTDVIRGGMYALLEYADAQARAIIGDLPDGSYAFHDYMEGHVASLGAIRIALTMHVRGDRLYLDFHDTDPQVPAAINMPTSGKTGHWMIVPALVKYFKTVDPHITYNSGMVRAIELGIPQGSLLNPDPHAAVGTRAATMFRVFDVVSACLAQAARDRIPAAGSGQGSIVVVSTIDLESGEKRISVVQPLCGGCGGRPHMDGLDGVDFSLGSLRNVPTESLETEMPVLILEYGLREDSCGHGRFRGGNGVRLRVKTLTPHTQITARGMERYLFRPWGLYGGGHGTTGYTRLTRHGLERDLGQIDLLDLEPGDVIHFGTQGAGGYGDPLDRDPNLVLEDVLEGLVSAASAFNVYGVVLSDGRLDPGGTAVRRQALRDRAPSSATFDLGPEREAFEAAWPPDVQSAIRRVAFDAPPSLRHFVKQQLRARLQARMDAGRKVSPEDVPDEHARLLRELDGVYVGS